MGNSVVHGYDLDDSSVNKVYLLQTTGQHRVTDWQVELSSADEGSSLFVSRLDMVSVKSVCLSLL